MSKLPVATHKHDLFRPALLLFAFVLACQAIWILAAEINRPSLSSFPIDGQGAAAIAEDRDAATLAASLGFIRGDLWADCALTYLDLFWSNDQARLRKEDPKVIERGYKVADRALTLAPHDARIWLVLARIKFRFNWINQKAAAAAIRMSYYTGTNRPELIPLRLQLAVHTEALADKDFQELVAHDIRVIVSRKPELKPAIVTAYSEASPLGRRFIEDVLKDTDPNLLGTLRASG